MHCLDNEDTRMWIVWSLSAMVGVSFFLSMVENPPGARRGRRQTRAWRNQAVQELSAGHGQELTCSRPVRQCELAGPVPARLARRVLGDIGTRAVGSCVRAER